MMGQCHLSLLFGGSLNKPHVLCGLTSLVMAACPGVPPSSTLGIGVMIMWPFPSSAVIPYNLQVGLLQVGNCDQPSNRLACASTKLFQLKLEAGSAFQQQACSGEWFSSRRKTKKDGVSRADIDRISRVSKCH